LTNPGTVGQLSALFYKPPRTARDEKGSTMPSQEKAARALERHRNAGILARGDFVKTWGLDDDPSEELPSAPLIASGKVEEITLALLRDLPELHPACRDFFAWFGPIIDDLRDCTAVLRLSGLHTFGIKADPRESRSYATGCHETAVVTAPYGHDRWTHSTAVAATMAALCLRLDIARERMAVAVLGALLHDVGHSAFSHDGDELLVAKGWPNHEVRGQDLVRADADIVESLAMAGATPDGVVAVMAERGPLGALQKVADTLGYVMLDAAITGMGDLTDLARRLLAATKDVHEDGTVGATDAAPYKELVHWRGVLSRDVYYHLRSMVAAAALQRFLNYLAETDALPLARIAHDTDAGIHRELSFRLNRPPNAVGRRWMTYLDIPATPLELPTWAASLWAIANGAFAELEHWEYRGFPTQHDLDAWLATLPVPALATVFVAVPYDYLRKSYRVRLPDGAITHIVADEALRSPESTQWTAFVFRDLLS
jgi:hypothetical protein